MFDIIIIGAGVVGAAIGRELSKYQLKIMWLEKEADVSCGASKANSGIVHGGFDAKPGTLKAKLNVEGNRMFEQLNQQLNFGYTCCGSYVIAFNDDEMEELNKLRLRGIENNVEGLEIINGETLLQREPYVAKNAKGALYAKYSGITSPYEMTIALAENAVANGVILRLDEEVVEIANETTFFKVKTTKNEYESKIVINAAGLYSDKIAQMIDDLSFRILPRKGQYLLLDKTQSKYASSVLFQVPNALGKGILVTPTLHGNLMIGPNSEQIMDKTDTDTDLENLKSIIKTARKSVDGFELSHSLTSFSGIRATSDRGDFIIERSKINSQMIHVAGIESPGLTASPAIAMYVLELVRECGQELISKSDFNPNRNPIIVKKDSSFKGKTEHIDPSLHIICRCEKVTEAEIVDSMTRGIPVKSLDGVKRRCRTTMGFCQGEYCAPRVQAVMQNVLGRDQEIIIPRSEGSGVVPRRLNHKLLKTLDDTIN